MLGKGYFLLHMSLLAIVGAACGNVDEATGTPASSEQATEAATPSPTPQVTQAATPSPTRQATPTPSGPLDTNHVRALFGDWPNTDPTTLTVDPTEIIRGCFGKDCIAALDVVDEVSIRNPKGGEAQFRSLTEAVITDEMPIAYITINGQTRGYPLAIMMWHEIVNDNVGGVPVAITFCPLCNTAISFERTVDGQILDFGVSGNLRHSDLIMFDRQTESWWQQATGEAIAGVHAGTNLEPIVTSVVAFSAFKAAYPDADVLSAQTGFNRAYGINPYIGYDRIGSRPFLFRGGIDSRLPGLERVVTLGFNDEQLAVPFLALQSVLAANVIVGETPVAVLWAPGTNTALGGEIISSAADIGAAIAYSPIVDGQLLEFEPLDQVGMFTDTQTNSTWLVTGMAIAGELAGTQLETLAHTTQFWFSWAAFFPDTEVWAAE